jgi:hypothetical protein
MFGTTAGNPARHDLAALRNIVVKDIRALVIDIDG